MKSIAILLCAGFATRMGDLVRDVPKPLLPVADHPVLDYLLDQLRALSAFSEIHVVCNARHAEAFDAWADARRASVDARLFVHNDGSTDNSNRLGAVGDLAFVLDRLAEPPDGAFVAAGDNILRFSLAPLQRRFFHERRDFILAFRETDPARLRRTGVLELADDDRVLAFHEKPADPPSQWACPPIYFLTRDALAQVHPHLEREPDKQDEIGYFIATLAAQQRLHAIRLEIEQPRLDIGSPESYRAADEILRCEPAIRL